jgi:catechol 2,3-dioxygenase-like lactoylglutathione lyase family enzyme
VSNDAFAKECRLVSDQGAVPDVVALRPFVPAKDFETSLRFYADLGFTARRITQSLAALELGPFSFLLQEYDVPGFAGNFMMQLLVNDLAGWWGRIEGLDLGGRYGVRAPRAPAIQPWGLTVAYVVDPSGVLWHVVQKPG